MYVDDFKLSGPKEHLAPAWKALRSKMNIEDPKPLGVFLGCDHKTYTRKLPSGVPVRCVEYDYQSFLESSLVVYREIAKKDGYHANLHKVGTPFLAEDQKCADARVPQPGENATECPWCKHTFATVLSGSRPASHCAALSATG